MEIIDEKAVDELTYLKHKSIYVFLGVTLPVVCAVLNYILLEGRAINVDVIGNGGIKISAAKSGLLVRNHCIGRIGDAAVDSILSLAKTEMVRIYCWGPVV